MNTSIDEALAGSEKASVLQWYVALEAASREMLAAARVGDWDGVCRIEGACVLLVAQLRQALDEGALPPCEQDDRIRLLRAILDNDAEIRRICEPLPWLLDPGAGTLPSSAALH